MILTSCGISSHDKYYYDPTPIYKPLDVNKKYTPMVYDAMQDFAKSSAFEEDLTFQVQILMQVIETSEILLEIQSNGSYYRDSDLIIPNPLSLYEVGTYRRIVPNRYWQLGERIILWNDQDTSHKISQELRSVVEKHISLSKEYAKDTTKPNKSVNVLYYYKRNKVEYYKKIEVIKNDGNGKDIFIEKRIIYNGSKDTIICIN